MLTALATLPYPIEVDVIVSDSHVTSSSTVSHSNTNATPTVDTNITNVKLQISTMHTSQVCTAQSESTIATMSLNPVAPEFVSSHSVPVTYQSTWVHNPILNLPIASATANVKNDSKGQQNAESATAQMPCPNTRHTDPSVNERQNISTPAATTEQGLIELAKSLADQVSLNSLNRLPPPEPSIFLGIPFNIQPGRLHSRPSLIKDVYLQQKESIT